MSDTNGNDDEYDETDEVSRILREIGKHPPQRDTKTEIAVIRYKVFDIGRNMIRNTKILGLLWDDYQQRRGREKFYVLWLALLTLITAMLGAVIGLFHH